MSSEALKVLHSIATQLQGLAEAQGMRAGFADASPISLFEKLVVNSEIHKASKDLFNDGYYSLAIEEACKSFSQLVKHKSSNGKDDGFKLMMQAFNENNPTIKLNTLSTITEQDEQKGFMHMAAGLMSGIRNPRAHTPEFADDQQTCVQLLCFIDYLMSKVKNA